MNEELKKIKKLYGEEMAHLCRELFSTILEKEGLLLELFTNNFNPSRFLYEDIYKQDQIEEFKNHVYSLVDIEKKENITNKTPLELLNDAGYDLYECKTEEDIQRFKKYYTSGEELCTFRGNRLNSCYVFFAVKKDVEDIKREDYENPERQDLYGTSVISIQFSRGNKNTLSIKNRYNHTVSNPDATFGNNLENIIPGLTLSFRNTYKLNVESNDYDFELDGYVKANDGKYYKYNYEENNVYYCPDNIIIDNYEVKKYDPSRYLLIDNFVLDLKEKTIELYDTREIDGFVDSLTGMYKISVTNTEYGKEIRITFKDKTKEVVIIKIDKTNNIIGLNNPNLKETNPNFLCNNEKIKEINLPNLEVAGDYFLHWNLNLKEINLPSLTKASYKFLSYNEALTKVNLPELRIAGNEFLRNSTKLIELNLPKLEYVEDNFLYYNEIIEKLNLPKLKHVGNNFLSYNQSLKELILPELISVGNRFLNHNKILTKLNLPKLKAVKNGFLNGNNEMIIFSAPNLISAEDDFMFYNEKLTELNLPSLISVGINFLFCNSLLSKLNAPLLRDVIKKQGFLNYNYNKDIIIENLNNPPKMKN